MVDYSKMVHKFYGYAGAMDGIMKHSHPYTQKRQKKRVISAGSRADGQNPDAPNL